MSIVLKWIQPNIFIEKIKKKERYIFIKRNYNIIKDRNHYLIYKEKNSFKVNPLDINKVQVVDSLNTLTVEEFLLNNIYNQQDNCNFYLFKGIFF